MKGINKTAKAYYEKLSGTGVQEPSHSFGGYQFISLKQIVNQFIISYVGDGNIIPKVKKTAVEFHAQRALQELSFDTLKSIKSIEVEVPNTLTIPLPHDYINYVKLSSSDPSGIKKILYPQSKTSNPFPILQKSDGSYNFDVDNDGISEKKDLQHQNTKYKKASFLLQTTTTIDLQYIYNPSGSVSEHDATTDLEVGMFIFSEHFPRGTKITALTAGTSFTNGGTVTLDTASINDLVVNAPDFYFSNDLVETSDNFRKFKSHTSSATNQDDYEDDTRWYAEGRRYGIDPQYAQDNGSYFIDELQGRIYFASNLIDKTIILDYLSDGLSTTQEMVVHKFAEEAMYKCIAYAIMSTKANVQEYVVRRFQKDKFAATRKAKLRLSNLKIEELTQILRGKSKQIKH
tara:strand:- start:12780 stop:13985 length:1206 start_codon:yes stop_codon:yes gene_type:complete